MQTDPIGQAGGLNIYNYTGSDPVNFSDPSGLYRDRSNPSRPGCYDLYNCDSQLRLDMESHLRSRNELSDILRAIYMGWQFAGVGGPEGCPAAGSVNYAARTNPSDNRGNYASLRHAIGEASRANGFTGSRIENDIGTGTGNSLFGTVLYNRAWIFGGGFSVGLTWAVEGRTDGVNSPVDIVNGGDELFSRNNIALIVDTGNIDWTPHYRELALVYNVRAVYLSGAGTGVDGRLVHVRGGCGG